MMAENVCKSLRFNTISAITTIFGRKRRTLECGLHDVACVAGVIGGGEGRGKGGEKKLGGLGRGERECLLPRHLYGRRPLCPLPEPLHFFSLPSLPLPFTDVFCESLFFRIKMASV